MAVCCLQAEPARVCLYDQQKTSISLVFEGVLVFCSTAIPSAGLINNICELKARSAREMNRLSHQM